MAIKRFYSEDKFDRRYCDVCGKALPGSYKGSTCADCKDDALYKEVKEFILHNEATELEVADKFDLPLDTIRRWIREGHLSYKDQKGME